MRPAVLLTRIWGVILACLATFFLAGLFLVAAGDNEDFTDADRAAIRAMTEAGLASLEAQVAASPVEQTSGILYDARMQEALASSDDTVEPGQMTVGEQIEEFAEAVRVRTGDGTVTVALLDSSNSIKAVNGAAALKLTDLIDNDALTSVASNEESLFSITLDGKLHVAKLSKADDAGNRILGIAELDTRAGSMFRRVIGSSNPAALVRKGKLVGELIGGADEEEIVALAKAHYADAPSEGASPAFKIGEGSDARLGSLGRLPGPAGRGEDGALLVVLSGKTAAASRHDLASTLSRARDEGGLPTDKLVLLLGLAIVTAALAIYLPGLEGLAPLRRLTAEFQAMAQGTQHALFHDRYAGRVGELARSANAAHEALRTAYLAELEIEEEEFEANPTAPRARARSGAVRRPTRSHRKAPTGKRTPQGGRKLRSSKSRQLVEAAPGPGPVGPESLGDLEDPDEAIASAPAREPAPAREELPPSRPEVAAPPELMAPEPTPVAPTRPATPPTAVPPVAKPAAPVFKAPAPAPMPTAAPPRPATTAPTAPVAPAGGDEEDEYYREVYEEFLQVKQACGEATANFTFDKFAKKLAKQTADIKKKREGVKDVKFTVYVKDGKAALRAKVVKA